MSKSKSCIFLNK